MPLFPASPVLGRLFQGFRVQRIARGCLRGSLTFTAFWGEDKLIQHHNRPVTVVAMTVIRANMFAMPTP